MMNTLATPQALSEILHYPNSLLETYQQKIQQLLQWNRYWQKNISGDLAAHTRIANFREGCLIVEVDNPSWASQLRYWIPELLVQLKTFPVFSSLQAIQWYVKRREVMRPEQMSTVSITPKGLSPANCSLLMRIADTIPQQALRIALQRFSQLSTA
jgi:hypothetical protein